MGDYFWDGAPKVSSGTFDGLARSERLEIGGDALERPTREDYRACLEREGLLQADESWEDRLDLVVAAQAHWHLARFSACVFSAYLSGGRREHGWHTVVPERRDGLEQLALFLGGEVAPRLADPEVEIVSVVLPFLDGASELARLLRRLDALPGWSVAELSREYDPGRGELVRLGVRVGVELGHESEVLGFGPQPMGARTRRAPFTELAIRAKPPPRPRENRRAYMADVRLPGVSGADFAAWGAETNTLRRRVLGDDQHERGKAKVTFALPAVDWESSEG